MEKSHLIKWLEIREENGRAFPSNLTQLRCDMDHSALLQRLVEGDEPLPEPPPRAFSYPWYELLEKGVDHPFEVNEMGPGNSIFNEPTLVIDQSPWKIIQKLGPEAWIAAYLLTDTPKLVALAQAAKMNLSAFLSEKIHDMDFHTPQKLSASRWRVFSPGQVQLTSTLAEPQFRKQWTVEKIP